MKIAQLHVLTTLQTNDKEDYRVSDRHPTKLAARSGRDIILQVQCIDCPDHAEVLSELLDRGLITPSRIVSNKFV